MGILGKLLGLDKYEFNEVRIKRQVVDEIVKFAKANHPNEFSAFLKGKTADKKLVVDGIIYQNFFSSHNSCVVTANIPITAGAIGTVHSHPGPRTTPSRADLFFFSKYGSVNLIIGMPYSAGKISAYDSMGRRINFKII